jgi:hypothetical protein
MKNQTVLVAVSIANLALLLFLLTQIRAVEAQSAATVLRGRALEIVDDQGRVRASLKVQTPSGEALRETVILRLVDPNGRPAVKLSATDRGAGLSLISPGDATYVILDSDGFLKLLNQGREQLIKP